MSRAAQRTTQTPCTRTHSTHATHSQAHTTQHNTPHYAQPTPLDSFDLFWAASQAYILLDLGFVAGTVVEVEMLSPSGEPTAYRVRNSLIALHREQAKLVMVKPAIEMAACAS